jgi:hypothetical protein
MKQTDKRDTAAIPTATTLVPRTSGKYMPRPLMSPSSPK